MKIDESRHIKDKEPPESEIAATSMNKRRNGTKRQNIKCYKYDERGHYARECRKLKEKARDDVDNDSNDDEKSTKEASLFVL